MSRVVNNVNTPGGTFSCLAPDLFDGRAVVPLRVSATTRPLTIKLPGGNGHPAQIVIESASADAPVTIEGCVCAEDHSFDRPLIGGPLVRTAPGEVALTLNATGWIVAA